MLKMTRSHATVLGATGFTGRYVCKEIAEQLRSLGPKFTWSIASRKEEALKALRDEIEAWGCPKESLPEIVLADVSNEESLVQACLQTRCEFRTDLVAKVTCAQDSSPS